MLENLGIENLAVCENHGKKHKLRVIEKKGGSDAKKDKRLTDKQVSAKDFT